MAQPNNSSSGNGGGNERRITLHNLRESDRGARQHQSSAPNGQQTSSRHSTESQAHHHLLPETQGLVKAGFYLSGSDLVGPVSTSLTKRMAGLTAFAGMLAQLINLITTWPFAVLVTNGVLGGTVLSLLVYASSNILQKVAAIMPFERNRWASIGLITYAIVTLTVSIPSPIGVGLMQYHADISNRYAARITYEQALAPYEAGIKAAKGKRSYAEEVQKKCDRKVKEFEAQKGAGNPAYQNTYLEAYGTYDKAITPGFWNRFPIESLPLCPKAMRLKAEVAKAQETSEEALETAKARIKAKYGESYTAYLKAEQPTLYESYFYPRTGRMRFRREEINELMAIIDRGEPGVKATMWSAAFLSGVTSLASVLLTWRLAVLPAVRASWLAKTARTYQERLRALRRDDDHFNR